MKIDPTMETPWKCYCGHLHRLMLRGVRCPICRTECTLVHPSDNEQEREMADWLACDYQHMGIKNAVHLTLHTRRLVGIMKSLWNAC
jgi:hypothetical protein